jgi:hypothetical protein
LPYYFSSFRFRGEGPAFYNNTQFISAFAQSFTSFAISLDPNVEINPASITPRWDMYNGLGRGPEMVFNKTEGDKPDVRPVKTDGGLVRRCECVLSIFPPD